MPDFHFKKTVKFIGKSGGGQLLTYAGRILRTRKRVIEDMLFRILVKLRDCHACAEAA